jgi:hypothetical protein
MIGLLADRRAEARPDDEEREENRVGRYRAIWSEPENARPHERSSCFGEGRGRTKVCRAITDRRTAGS